MIIAIDFDGTIVSDEYPLIGYPLPYAAETIKDLRDEGHTLILYTCRTSVHLLDAKLYLADKCLLRYFSKANENDDSRILAYGVDCRKISADVYIDDRAIGWTGWKQVREYFGLDKGK